MKKLSFVTIFMLIGFVSVTYAQTLNVNVGEVTYAHSASNTGDMVFNGGTSLTIEGKTYQLSQISSIKVGDNAVADNTVSVVWSGNTAAVVVAGNIASKLTIVANGATVSVVQSESLQNEVTYTLSGSSANGSFFMDGSYKANFVLNNLSLTNPSGAAIDIQDGKKIAVTVTGTNQLSDGAGGSHNATFYINGHPEFDGTGSLTITGKTKHALTADECMVLKSGTITVSEAASDGFHISQYFRMDGGTVNISSTGDGIDIGIKGANKGTADQYENNGMAFMNGGTLTIKSTGTASKGLKAESDITWSGTTASITCSGNATYDAEEKDISSPSAMKTDGAFTINSGDITLHNTGSGGKGINATTDITFNNGTVKVCTTGAVFVYGADDSKPHGVKTDGNIIINGGNIYVAASSDSSNAFKTDNRLTINGGTVMGIGQKKCEPTGGTQGYKLYSGVNVAGGSTVTYDGVSFTVPSDYSNSKAKIVVSKAGL
jgi:hypothetical protein